MRDTPSTNETPGKGGQSFNIVLDRDWFPNKMNNQEYFDFAQEFFNSCIEITKKKNADYTGGSDDPFANFTSIEVLGIDAEVGFLTRMMDKIKRIASFVKQGKLQVKDESVQDTLSDLANYCCLFAGYLKSINNRGAYPLMANGTGLQNQEPGSKPGYSGSTPDAPAN